MDETFQEGNEFANWTALYLTHKETSKDIFQIHSTHHKSATKWRIRNQVAREWFCFNGAKFHAQGGNAERG